ncbi:MAG TPA: hypothetical protein VFQ71_10180 [Gaiellales bacterium]|nr:hypothetical protein [Gaiellales bacterium]
MALLAVCLFGAAASAFGQSSMPQASLSPTVRLTAKPQAYSRSSTAKFAWAKTNATATACSLDGHRYAGCKTHITYTGLAAGKHTFVVRVTHGARVKVVTARWTIDLTGPAAPVVSGGSASWVTVPSDAALQATATDVGTGVASYEHRVSPTLAPTPPAWGEITPGAGLTITRSGRYTVEFRAVDRAGNVSPWSADATVWLDDDPPSPPTVSGGGSDWKGTVPVTVTASGSDDALHDPVTYRYRTSSDGGATWLPATWASGSTVNVSAEGTTLVEFEAGDSLGNWSASRDTAVNIDRNAPTVPVVTGGTGATWSDLASVTVTASGSTDSPGSGVAGYEFQTQLNGVTSPIRTGSSVKVSDEGKTMVTFWAVDVAGRSSGPATVQVWLDQTAPAAPTVSGGSNGTWQNTPSVSFSASGSTDAGGSGLARYEDETSTDGGATWSQPATAAGGLHAVTGEGSTLVRLRAVDGAGNPSPWKQAPSAATIDRTPPTTPVLSNATSSWVNSASVTVKASGSTDSGSGVKYYEYQTQLNGVTSPLHTGVSSVVVSAEGKTTVTFWAVDNSGQVSSPVSGQVWIDRTAPSVPDIGGGTMAKWLNVPSVTFTGSGSSDPAAADGSQGSGGLTYQYRTKLNSAINWGTPASQSTLTISAAGWTDVEVRAVDAAGNASDWTVSGPSLLGANWALIDRTAPAPPTVKGGSSTCTAGTISITATATDSTSSIKSYAYRESLDNGATWPVQGTGQTASITTPGRWIVQFQAVDQANNASAWAPATAGAANTACHL